MVFKKSLPRNQVSDDLLWGIAGNNHAFLRKSQGQVFSLDPTNLSGVNLKRDSGITSQEGFGIEINVAERKHRVKKQKVSAKVVRFDLNLKSRRKLGKKKLVALKSAVPSSNNAVFSSQKRLTVRSIVKVLRRGLKTYRPDLHKVAFKRLRKLNKFIKRRNSAARKARKEKAQ